MRLVSPTGATKKSPTASARASTMVPIHVPLPISSGSPSPSRSWALADCWSAPKPIFSDSASATTPRTTGSRKARCFLSHETSGYDSTAISPSGVRTATAHVETPRIITPSRTACPPTGASRLAIRRPSGSRVALTLGRELLGRGLAAPGARDPALEPLDAAAGVDQLLPARVERMAVGADLHVDLALGRTGRELVAAGAAHVRFGVLGMDSLLHGMKSRGSIQRSGWSHVRDSGMPGDARGRATVPAGTGSFLRVASGAARRVQAAVRIVGSG